MNNAPARHHTLRSDLPTRGGQVAAIAEMKGKPLMPWQRDAVDVMLEYDPDTGLYRYSTIVLTVPRQAGKTTLVGSMADHRCIRTPGSRAWITMQNGKTADSWMRNDHQPSLRPFGDPEKKATPYKVSLRAGEVGVIWKGVMSTFLTFPPKRDALHSKQSDLAIISEAWAYSKEQGADVMQAVSPTQATRDSGGHVGAQTMIESTLGDDASVFLDNYYDLGVASLAQPETTTVCIVDYGIPDDADAENLDVIAAYHPAFGRTVSMRSLRVAYERFLSGQEAGGAAGFARGYGNRATRTRESAIPSGVWTATARPRVEVPTHAGIGLDATPSGDRVAIGAGWRQECDLAPCTGGQHGHLELLHAGPPTRELPQLLIDLCRRNRSPLHVDRAAIGALEILDAVGRHSPSTEIRYLTMPEYAGACGAVYRGVLDGTVHHHNQSDLTGSVEGATKRDLGDGGMGWGRKKSSGSIAELVSVTVGLKGYDTQPAVAPKPRIVTSRKSA